MAHTSFVKRGPRTGSLQQCLHAMKRTRQHPASGTTPGRATCQGPAHCQVCRSMPTERHVPSKALERTLSGLRGQGQCPQGPRGKATGTTAPLRLENLTEQPRSWPAITVGPAPRGAQRRVRVPSRPGHRLRGRAPAAACGGHE